MKNHLPFSKSRITLFALLAAAAWAALSFTFADRLTERKIAHLLESERTKLEIQGAGLATNIDENFAVFHGIAKTISSVPVISRALTPGARLKAASYFRTGPETAVETANHILARMNRSLGTDVLWISDRAGECIAASDAGKKGSHIGRNFKDSELFQAALKGKLGFQVAYEPSLDSPALLFSAPVVIYGGNEIIGATLVKVDIGRFSHWLDPQESFVVDEYGIVLTSHHRKYELHALEGARFTALPEDQLQTRYGRNRFEILPVAYGIDKRHPEVGGVGSERTQMLISAFPIGLGGLSVHVAAPLGFIDEIRGQRNLLFALIWVLGIVGIATITGVAALILSDRRFRAIFNNSSVGIAILDPQRRIIKVNPELEQMLGYPNAELIGQDFLTFLAREELGAALSGGAPAHKSEWKLVHKDGREVWTRVSRRPFQGSGQLLIVADITDQKKSERIASETQVMMISAAKMTELGKMAASIAHEINNPLAIITGKATHLLEAAEAPTLDRGLIRAGAAKIESTAQRIAKIIRSMKGFSRNSDSDPFAECDLRVIIEDGLSMVREQISRRDIALLLELPPPDAPFPRVECRSSEIAQVLLNLLNNAMDAVEKLPSPWIELSLRQTDLTVLISVTDSGSGIPRKIAERIMEPFFTTKEVGKGTGLGLSISCNILKAHHGRLRIDDRCPNTRFVIELPLKQSKAAELLPLNFDEAIVAHINWKQRLAEYFRKPDRSISGAEAADDRWCSLGQWIHQRQGSEERLQELHARFHRIAATLIGRANQGEDLLEQVVLGSESEYERTSQLLIAELLKLKSGHG